MMETRHRTKEMKRKSHNTKCGERKCKGNSVNERRRMRLQEYAKEREWKEREELGTRDGAKGEGKVVAACEEQGKVRERQERKLYKNNNEEKEQKRDIQNEESGHQKKKRR